MKIGRPKTLNPLEQLNFRISKKDKDRIEKLSIELNTNISEVIRYLINNSLNDLELNKEVL